MKRMVGSLLVVVLILTMVFPSALAASYKGQGSGSFTVTTGNKAATLTVKNQSGKVEATVWKNPAKGTTKRKSGISWYGKFEVSVSGLGSKTVNYPFNSKATFKLEPNRSYKVTVRYKGLSSQVDGCWDQRFTKDPSVSLSVNNWAKIK